MTNWAILPVKAFRKGKSRLRGALTLPELERLNQECFQRTFTELLKSACIDRIVTVSREKLALDWALAQGGLVIYEKRPSSLNQAVRAGLDYILARESGQVLIVPTDLPLMTAADVQSLFSVAQPPRSLVIVPDLAQAGTNALLLSQPDFLFLSFGQHSFQNHCAQALNHGLRLIVYLNRSIQQDLDTPADLNRLHIRSEVDLISTMS